MNLPAIFDPLFLPPLDHLARKVINAKTSLLHRKDRAISKTERENSITLKHKRTYVKRPAVTASSSLRGLFIDCHIVTSNQLLSPTQFDGPIRSPNSENRGTHLLSRVDKPGLLLIDSQAGQT